MKRGDIFVHAQWLNAKNEPLVCEVTAVRQGVVYYKEAGTPGKAKDYFPIEDEAKRVKKPAPTFVDVSTVTEYGLTQRLSASVRCF